MSEAEESVLYNETPAWRWPDLLYVRYWLIPDIRIYISGLRAIFAVTAVLTIMIIAAPPGLKNITAQ